MKISLEFNDEEAFQAKCAFHGYALWGILWELDSRMRSRYKHDDEISESEAKFLEEMREMCSLCHFIEEEM